MSNYGVEYLKYVLLHCEIGNILSSFVFVIIKTSNIQVIRTLRSSNREKNGVYIHVAYDRTLNIFNFNF